MNMRMMLAVIGLMAFWAQRGSWLRLKSRTIPMPAGSAAFAPCFAFPAWLATMPDEAVRKCLDFMVHMAVAGFVYFAVWSFADWLSCLCSRFDGDGRKQDVQM